MEKVAKCYNDRSGGKENVRNEKEEDETCLDGIFEEGL